MFLYSCFALTRSTYFEKKHFFSVAITWSIVIYTINTQFTVPSYFFSVNCFVVITYSLFKNPLFLCSAGVCNWSRGSSTGRSQSWGEGKLVIVEYLWLETSKGNAFHFGEGNFRYIKLLSSLCIYFLQIYKKVRYFLLADGLGKLENPRFWHILGLRSRTIFLPEFLDGIDTSKTFFLKANVNLKTE